MLQGHDHGPSIWEYVDSGYYKNPEMLCLIEKNQLSTLHDWITTIHICSIIPWKRRVCELRVEKISGMTLLIAKCQGCSMEYNIVLEAEVSVNIPQQ